MVDGFSKYPLGINQLTLLQTITIEKSLGVATP